MGVVCSSAKTVDLDCRLSGERGANSGKQAVGLDKVRIHSFEILIDHRICAAALTVPLTDPASVMPCIQPRRNPGGSVQRVRRHQTQANINENRIPRPLATQEMTVATLDLRITANRLATIITDTITQRIVIEG